LILNISSMVSKMVLPGIGGYAGTKHMLNGLSLTARAELAKDNIRVIIVYPRQTTTAFGKNGIGNRSMSAPSAPPQATLTQSQIDNAEHVATKILEAIQNEPVEQFMA